MRPGCPWRQVLLPPSVGAELMAQGAERNAAPFFEVRTAAGGLTHVSVLDYTAAEGTIGLPLKVRSWLRGMLAAQHV